MVSITGCPGVGKSVVGFELARSFERGVVMEMDVTGRKEYASSPELILEWFGEWVRIAVSVAQRRRFLVLTGFSRPHELESRPDRGWLSEIVHIALVCDREELRRRLAGRWDSRLWPEAEVEGLCGINEEVRLLAERDPSVSLVDTTSLSRAEVVDVVSATIQARVALAG
jgi:broad-specificity NMP kinase